MKIKLPHDFVSTNICKVNVTKKGFKALFCPNQDYAYIYQNSLYRHALLGFIKS